MPSRWQKIVIQICRLLGVRTFKKYWVSGGSFWNKNHIDPSKNTDLQKVIDDSWDYTRQHTGQLFIEALIVTVSYFSGYMTPKQVWGFIPIGLIIHGYAMLTHYYNRIMAADRMKRNTQHEKDNPPPPKPFYKINTITHHTDDETGYIVFRGYTALSPLLPNKYTAEHFITFLEKGWSSDTYDISELIFTEGASFFYKLYLKRQ